MRDAPTPLQVQALALAMDQLLDDMGVDGLSVCGFAKAQARVAYEPFRDLQDNGEYLMPLDVAREIVESVKNE